METTNTTGRTMNTESNLTDITDADLDTLLGLDAPEANLIDITNLSDDGLDALLAIRTGGVEDVFVFDGNYSGADASAIADAFEAKTGKRPAAYWMRDLCRPRHTAAKGAARAIRDGSAAAEGRILKAQERVA